jgi:membrane-bound lytic murein transglycosylase MltF
MQGQEEELAQRFLAEVNPAYDEILADLARESPDLAALSRRYQQVRTQDYFRSPKGEKVRKALISSRGGTKR